MGILDWLFGKRKKSKKSTGGAAAQRQPAAAAVDVANEEDDDFSEATTFVSRRLSPTTQVAIKALRGYLGDRVTHYEWELSEGAETGCKKFADNGPYLVADGLSGKAPVPGRETPCNGCNCTVVPAGSD